MAELHSRSALVKSSSSSISYLEHMGSSLMEQPPTERSVVPISLSSKLVGLEGDRNSYQLERGGELPPGPNHVKRGRWEEVHLDAAFCRQSNATALSGPVSSVERFSVSLPNFSSCTSLSAQVSNVEGFAASFSSRCNGNGPGHSSPPPISVQCSPFVSQQLSSSGLSYLPIANNRALSRSSPPAMPYKQGGGIGSAECQTIQLHSVDNANTKEVNVTEVLAELERERRKNAELLDKLSSLEAQLEEREKAFAKVDSHGMMQNSIRKFKRVRKAEKVGDIEDADVQNVPHKVSQVKQENLHTGLEVNIPQDTLVNWMSREEIQFPDYDKYKDGDSAMDEYGESDDSDDDDDFDEDDDHDEEDEEEDEDDESCMRDNGRNEVTKQEEGEGGETVFQGLDGASSVLDERKSLDIKVGVKEDQNEAGVLPVVSSHREDVNGDDKRVKKKNRKRKGGKKNKRYKVLHAKKCPGYDIGPLRGPNSVLSYKKAPKMAFCPKEVKRIMESGVLALKNAQSHTIRKIIVFASLGIRHGCEDMYELDFNYFSILRKGEPYVSPKDPGEHVVYEQPGVRRKIFYPNRQNPILCPVRILEEEKTMRPSGPSCPSCLFLCIKYGGRTRNLPQNEYVRQRMGRNKLKSFGPLMCQMALLVHIRTGSFFFKALGITLLFMAGFPDDLVQKETKYRNLDLLQKYYRSDEDAEGEELFHPYPMFYAAQAMTNTASLPGKGASTGGKSSGKKQPPLLLSKPHISQKALYLPSLSARSMSSTQFGPLGFSPVPMPSGVTLPQSASVSGTCNVSITTSRASRTGPFLPPPPYAIFPPYALQRPPSGFLPMPMWHNVNSYPPNIYPSSSYRYQPFTASSQYGSHPSQPFYNQPFSPPFSSNVNEGIHKKDDELDVSDSDSESSSSETEEKSNKANILESKLV